MLITLGLVGASLAQEKTSLTPEMSLNLRAMNSILLNVIMDQSYEGVAKSSVEISTHAKEITEKVPVTDPEAVAKFKAYALQLEANADILKVLAEKIEKGKDMDSEHVASLKKSASLTYGQIATTCVSCHQEFRVK